MVIFLELKYTVAPFYGRTHGYLEGNLTGRSCLSNKTTAITTRTYGLPSFKPTELISGEGGHTSFGKATPPKPLKQHHQVEIRCSKARAFGGLISLQVYMGTLTLVYMYHRYNRETKRKKRRHRWPYWVLSPLTVSLSSCHWYSIQHHTTSIKLLLSDNPTQSRTLGVH